MRVLAHGIDIKLALQLGRDRGQGLHVRHGERGALPEVGNELLAPDNNDFGRVQLRTNLLCADSGSSGLGAARRTPGRLSLGPRCSPEPYTWPNPLVTRRRNDRNRFRMNHVKHTDFDLAR